MKSHTIKQHDNLEALADFLEQIPLENFDMTCYFDAPTLDIRQETVDAHLDCGTSACVAGWAYVHHRNEWPTVEAVDVASEFGEFFGLEFRDVYSICLSNYIATAPEKADEIRTVLSTYDVTV